MRAHLSLLLSVSEAKLYDEQLYGRRLEFAVAVDIHKPVSILPGTFQNKVVHHTEDCVVFVADPRPSPFPWAKVLACLFALTGLIVFGLGLKRLKQSLV